jgi:predicted RNase H-like HicB family nuclease
MPARQTEGSMEYIAYLHKDRDSDFRVSFSDFPGCVTAGKTLEEARRMAAEALALHIEGMIEDGEAIPTPATLVAVADDPAMNGAVAFLVSFAPPGDRTVRVNIAAHESQVQKIDARAKRFGLSRSAYLIQAGLGHLEKNPRRSRA